MRDEGSALVYALGGGAGHLARGLAVARRLAPRPALVLHGAEKAPACAIPASARLLRLPAGEGPASLRARLLEASKAATTLVVDTFPAGLLGEIDDALLERFSETILVARYVRPGTYEGYEEAARRFRVRWLPYPPGLSEWEPGEPGAFVGHLVREIAFEGHGKADEPADLLVLGPARLLPPGLRARLPSRTVFLEASFEFLPRARRVLSVGAGYHISYELMRLGVPFGLFPLERRYDDQFRRAGLLGRAVTSRADLEALLDLGRRACSPSR